MRARRVENPTADVDNEPAFLSRRYEFARRTHAVARSLPTQQRLDSGQSAVRNGKLRLVEKRKLTAPQRSLQSRLGGRNGTAGQMRVEEHRAAAPRVLGAIHGRVRVAHEVIDRRAVIGEQRDADAGAYKVIAAADVHRQLQQLDDPVANRTGGVGIDDIAQNHRELITAQACDGVAFLRAGAQPLRNDRQKLVTGTVSDGVVDAFEMIEIDIQQRATAQTSGGVGKLLRQPVPEQDAIRQCREWIVVSLPVEPLVAGALRQRDREPLGELRTRAGQIGVGGPGRFTITNGKDGLHPVGHAHRPDPEELRANFLQRLEETVPGILTPGHGEAAAFAREGRDHVVVELDPSHRQIRQTRAGKVYPPAARGIGIP